MAAEPGGAEFVDGWLVAQVLGEGAYGEVRLLVHGASGAQVALKAAAGGQGAAREAALQRALRHPHVLRCLGAREHAGRSFLFLEFAPGGELFERIAPGVGLARRAARRYWRQLLQGLRYLHARGVAHRDIKPENLLLDHQDNIKISDFGMATLFRHGARERMLTRVCGTAPYCAPEVLRAAERPYRAAPADVWAAAVVLVAMLAGELPWERAEDTEARYADWRAGGEAGAWRRLRPDERRLLRGALAAPEQRARLDDLLLDPWLSADEPDGEREAEARVWWSQPSAPPAAPLSAAAMDGMLSQSRALEHAELRAELAAPGCSQPAPLSVPLRLTRVWLRATPPEALGALAAAAGGARLAARRLDARTLALEAGALRLRVWAWRVAAGEARCVLEFRRWRGCGLAFQRAFVALRDALAPLAAAAPAADVTRALRPPAAHMDVDLHD